MNDTWKTALEVAALVAAPFVIPGASAALGLTGGADAAGAGLAGGGAAGAAQGAGQLAAQGASQLAAQSVDPFTATLKKLALGAQVGNSLQSMVGAPPQNVFSSANPTIPDNVARQMLAAYAQQQQQQQQQGYGYGYGYGGV